MSLIENLTEEFLKENFQSVEKNKFSSKTNSITIEKIENSFRVFFTTLTKKSKGLFKSEIIEEDVECDFDFDSLNNYKNNKIKNEDSGIIRDCIEFLEHIKTLSNRKEFCSLDLNKMEIKQNERRNFVLDKEILKYEDKSGIYQDVIDDYKFRIENSHNTIQILLLEYLLKDNGGVILEEMELGVDGNDYKNVLFDLMDEIVTEFLLENKEDFIFYNDIKDEEKPKGFPDYPENGWNNERRRVKSIVSNDHSIFIMDGYLEFYDWVSRTYMNFSGKTNKLFIPMEFFDDGSIGDNLDWVQPNGNWKTKPTEKYHISGIDGGSPRVSGKFMKVRWDDEPEYPSSELITTNLLNNSKFNELWERLYDFPFSKKLYSYLKHHIESENQEKIIDIIKKNEKDIIQTKDKKESLLKELDKDSDGTLDLVQQTDDFHEILKKHEKNIIEIDRDYIKNFVKLSNYLKTKRNNLQNTFEILSKVEFSKDLESLSNILKNNIHTYNSLLLHSLSMIVSLTKDEMITFYEIYEMFDELNVYDSKHEKDMLNGIKSINSELGEVNKNLKEVGGKLGDISGQFYSLMNQMKESDERIINSIDDLTYTTSSSIESLSNNVQSELQSINSSIKFNNLLTGVQTYQMYKINLNTKSLKG